MSKRNYKDRSRSMARDVFWDNHDKQTYSCPDCSRGEGEIAGTFEVHHSDGNPYNNDPENLIGLCKACHAIREDRTPAPDAIRQILRSFKQSSSSTRESPDFEQNREYLLLQEIKHAMTGMSSSVIRQLGYDISEFEDITPKTRREAALFRRGAIEHGSKIYEEHIKPREERLSDAKSCDKCGESGQYLFVEPHKMYGDISDRGVFCEECCRELYKSLGLGRTSFDEIASEIPKHISENDEDGGDELSDRRRALRTYVRSK